MRKIALAFLGTIFATSTLAYSVDAADWADLKITVIYDADAAPTPTPYSNARDEKCPPEVPSHQMVVNSENMGIANFIAYVDARKSKLEDSEINPEAAKPSDEPKILDNLKCVFEPHVVVMRPGETLEVKNSDDTGHNANFQFLKNDQVNFLVPAQSSKPLKLEKGERLPIPVECNVHPWMKAFVVCFDLPYAATTDKNGEMVIEKLPVDREVTIKLWHENMNKSFKEAIVNGEAQSLKRGTMTVTVPADGLELEIKLKPDQFKEIE